MVRKMHTEEEFENETHYGFETENDETNKVNEPVTESEYHDKIQSIIASCHGHWSFKYAQNLNMEVEIQGKIPVIASDCLNQIHGLTGTKESDLVAVLIALDDRKVQRAIKAFYESKYPEMRRALYAWGKLQVNRG